LFYLRFRWVDIDYFSALLTVVDWAAVREGGLGVSLVLEQLAARCGLQVNHRPTVSHLLSQTTRFYTQYRIYIQYFSSSIKKNILA
jgi:hypothetical protein